MLVGYGINHATACNTHITANFNASMPLNNNEISDMHIIANNDLPRFDSRRLVVAAQKRTVPQGWRPGNNDHVIVNPDVVADRDMLWAQEAHANVDLYIFAYVAHLCAPVQTAHSTPEWTWNINDDPFDQGFRDKPE